MANTLSKEQHIQICRMDREGVAKIQIAKSLGVSRSTVTKHLMEERDRAHKYGDPKPLTDIDGLDDKSLMGILETNMRDGRPQESTQAVMAALRLRAEQSAGNPAAEPMTEEEDVEFKRYLREDVYTDMCNSCREKAVSKQVKAATTTSIATSTTDTTTDTTNPEETLN